MQCCTASPCPASQSKAPRNLRIIHFYPFFILLFAGALDDLTRALFSVPTEPGIQDLIFCGKRRPEEMEIAGVPRKDSTALGRDRQISDVAPGREKGRGVRSAVGGGGRGGRVESRGGIVVGTERGDRKGSKEVSGVEEWKRRRGCWRRGGESGALRVAKPKLHFTHVFIRKIML